MKIPYLKRSINRLRRSPKGFALIATISLLVLLALVAVGLLQLAAVSLRASRQDQYAQEARNQARLGLEIAIGQLQLELGPDQRVSAFSGVLDTNPQSPQPDSLSSPYILGVWNSWDNWLNAEHTTKRITIAQTYDKGRQPLFRRWLISDPNQAQLSEIRGVTTGGLGAPGDNKIKLLGAGTLGSSSNAQNYVYAGLVQAPSRTGRQGKFAWWISGENQKAKVNVESNSDTASNLLARTWDTPPPLVQEVRESGFNLGNLPTTNEGKSRLQSFDTISLAIASGKKTNAPYFHDVTTTSSGIFTDIRNGGLKKDLNLMLSQEQLPAALRPSNSAHAGLRPFSYDLKGYGPKITARPFGSWTHLHEWARVNNPSQLGTGQDVTSRLGNSSGAPFTYPAVDKTSSGGTGANWGSDPSDDRYVYYRDPVLLKFYQVYSMITTRNNNGNYDCDLAYSPTFVWWNPYNVELRIPADKLAAHSLVYKTGLLQLRAWVNGNIDWSNNAKKQQDAEGFSTYEFKQSNDPIYAYGQDWGNPFRQSVKGGDIVFKPGEILIFSHHEDRNISQNNFHPFAEGYRPEAVARHRVRLFSNKSLSAMQVHEFDLRFDKAPVMGSGEDWTWGGGNPGAFTMWMGHGSVPSSASGGSGMQGKIPASYLIDWNQKGKMILTKAKFNVGMTLDNPFLAAVTGWSIKSNTQGLSDGDYRTKSWAHSSPALSGGNIFEPTKQVKTYHPVELIYREVNGLNLGEIVPHMGSNGFFGGTGGEIVSSIPALELPLQQPFGLAGFSGYRLTPGWFDAAKTFGESKDLATTRRFAYMSGIPGVGIGNSFADPMIPGNKIYQSHNISQIKNPSNNKASGFLDDFWDHNLLINDSLWDSWFTSSLASQPKQAGSQSFSPSTEIIKGFFEGKTPLANFRFKSAITGLNPETVIAEVSNPDSGYLKSARYLAIDGAFNVNSTSEAAWTAFLMGLKNRQMLYSNNGKLSPLNARNAAPFSRHAIATHDKPSTDPISGIQSNGLNSWSSLILLDDNKLQTLARNIVKQVKLRGPFLNMSDFINRRITSDDTGLKGALQAAIDESRINSALDSYSAPNSSVYPNSKAEQGSIYQGALGYMVQSDLLAALSNTMQLRDDTFKIRAYGEIRSKDNRKVLSRAWCEAVVQRVTDYSDPQNTPETPALIDTANTGDFSANAQLTQINKTLGRKFKVISFKWLTPDEI